MADLNDRSLQGAPALSDDQVNIILESRALASRLAYLTRFYIFERLTGVSDPNATYNQILELAVKANELAQSIPGFTGDFVPIALTYFTSLKNLMDGMISGDRAMADESIRQLYAASDEYAKSLAALSPYWDETTWRDIFYLYNQNLVEEVLAVQIGDYNLALDVYEGLMHMALKRGDYFAEGLIHLLPEGQEQIPVAYFNMIKDFRKRRTEWAYLTRYFMVTRMIGLGDDQYVAESLYVLIRRLKERFEFILGDEIAEELYNILLIYVVRLQGLTDAIMSGDPEIIQMEMNEFYQFTLTLSSFLASVNPYWDETKWQELFNTSVGLIIEQAYEFQGGDYVAAIEIFEDFISSSLAIADYFAYGLFQYTVMDENNQGESVL